MKINKIMLENFRSFKGQHEINFSSINLFFGANGVGKSSIFKALNNFRQLKQDDIFIGESFASVSLTFDADIIQESWETYSDSKDIDLLTIIKEKDWALDFFRNFQLNAKSFFLKYGIEIKEIETDTAHIDYWQYGVNDTWFFEYYRGVHPFEFDKVRINLDHPIFESHPFLKLKSSRKSFDILNECFERLDGSHKGYVSYLLTRIIRQEDSHDLSRAQDVSNLIGVVEKYLEEQTNDNYKSIHKSLPVLLWILRVVFKAEPNLDELVHLGPLRKVPEMLMDRSNTVMDLSFFNGDKQLLTEQARADNYTGEFAWKNIFSSYIFNSNNEAHPPLKSETCIPLEKRVNAWLLDWFNTPYEIQFHRKFVFTADTSEKLQKFSTGKLSIEDLTAESARVVFRNVQNGSVSPAKDIGVGISQLTPVIVNALESRSFSVEQPELHIHPRMQTVLGDLFVFEGLFSAVKAAGEVTITTRCIEGNIQERHFNRKKVKDESFILVETHSEHLILRLLKRIREGILKPDDLAIYYFENNNGKTISNRIHIDSDGEFTTPWPEGFFDERLEELF
jgi:predicted ATPase